VDVHTTIARCAWDADTPDEATSRGIFVFRHGGRERQGADSGPPAAKPRPADLRCAASPDKVDTPHQVM
jgi:hypothetical protein